MNKTVWITGASSGIGKELVNKFSSEGTNVAASARRVDELNVFFGDKEFIQCLKTDVTDIYCVSETFQAISNDSFVNCLINNAGTVEFGSVAEQSTDAMLRMIETNLIGSIYTIKSVLPEMLKQNEGTIINIISVVVKKDFTGSAAYTASKSGLYGFTNVLREELKNTNIRVINILPGATATAIWPDKLLEKFNEKMMSPADVAELIWGLYAFKGSAVPEEIVLRPISGDL